jgi:hypothetical protein
LLATSRNDQNEEFFYNLLKVQMQNDGKGVTEKNTMEFVNVGRDMQVGHDTFHDYFFIDLMYDGMLFKQRYK